VERQQIHGVRTLMDAERDAGLACPTLASVPQYTGTQSRAAASTMGDTSAIGIIAHGRE
jgi:hypothetical protein